jgi:hypothetical protein
MTYYYIIFKKKEDALSRMPRLHHRVSEIQPEMRDLQAEDMLQLRRETGQVVPKRLARHALAVPNLPHRNPRAYDGCEEQTIVAGIADMCRSPPAANRRR